MPGTSSIDLRQRDGESGRLLRAYATEYRAAKRYRAFRFTLSALIAIAGPVLSWWSLPAAGVVAAIPGFWLVAKRLFIVPAERRHVRSAARIQERFDIRLFDLAWPQALAGAEPSEEDIADAARRGLRDQRLVRQQEEGWYPSTDCLPWPVNVLEAQRASATYGRRQHSAFAGILVFGIASATLAAIVVGGVADMSLVAWLTTFLWSSPPILLDAGELAFSHRNMAGRKAAIESEIDSLWRTELSNKGTLTADDCRAIQDAVCKLRLANAQAPEWFHWRYRRRNDANMDEAAAARRNEYRGTDPLS